MANHVDSAAASFLRQPPQTNKQCVSSATDNNDRAFHRSMLTPFNAFETLRDFVEFRVPRNAGFTPELSLLGTTRSSSHPTFKNH